MRHMRWTYNELLATPADVVERVWQFMNTEAMHNNIEIERARNRHGK